MAGSLYSQEGVDFYSIGSVIDGETIIARVRLPTTSTLSPRILIRDELNQFYPEVASQPSFDGVARVNVGDVGGGRTFFVEVGANGGLGIRGQYILDVIISSDPDDYPDLFATQIIGPATASSGDEVDVTWSVVNSGDSSTLVDSWTDEILLSHDKQLGGDFSLGRFSH